MIELFSNNLSVCEDEESEGVLIISGRGWENEPFQIYLREEEAQNLLWQLTYFMEDATHGN